MVNIYIYVKHSWMVSSKINGESFISSMLQKCEFISLKIIISLNLNHIYVVLALYLFVWLCRTSSND